VRRACARRVIRLLVLEKGVHLTPRLRGDGDGRYEDDEDIMR